MQLCDDSRDDDTIAVAVETWHSFRGTFISESVLSCCRVILLLVCNSCVPPTLSFLRWFSPHDDLYLFGVSIECPGTDGKTVVCTRWQVSGHRVADICSIVLDRGGESRLLEWDVNYCAWISL